MKKEKIDKFEASIDVLEERIHHMDKAKTYFLIVYLMAGFVYVAFAVGGALVSALPVTYFCIAMLILIIFLMAILAFGVISTCSEKDMLKFIIYFKKHLEEKK